MSRYPNDRYPEPYVTDVGKLYTHHRNCVTGVGIGYSVRNHTQNKINVRSRLGFSQNIDVYKPSFDFTEVDSEYDRNSVWLDIHLYFDEIKEFHNLFPETSNEVDRVIIRQLMKQVEYGINSSYSVLKGFSAHFGICLNSMIPNYGNNGFQSDLLGIIIQYDTAYTHYDILTNIPKAFLSYIRHDEIDFSSATYQLILLVDNSEQSDSLWTLQAGKPVNIKPIKNMNMASGIYIFLNKYHIREKPYIFISLEKAKSNDNLLREYGLSYTEKEILDTTRSADYVELKKTAEKKENECNQLILENEKKHTQLTELKTKLEKTNDRIAVLTQDVSSSKENIKQLTTINTTLDRNLERARVDTEKLRKEILEKEDKNRELKDNIRSLKHKHELEEIKRYKKTDWFSHALSAIGEMIDLAKRVGGVKILFNGMV